MRDLKCWPPKWRAASSGSEDVANGDGGILIAVRWDRRTQSLALTMEYEGGRHSAIVKDEVGLLTKLCLLLGWHIGRPLARIGTLELNS